MSGMPTNDSSMLEHEVKLAVNTIKLENIIYKNVSSSSYEIGIFISLDP